MTRALLGGGSGGGAPDSVVRLVEVLLAVDGVLNGGGIKFDRSSSNVLWLRGVSEVRVSAMLPRFCRRLGGGGGAFAEERGEESFVTGDFDVPWLDCNLDSFP